MLFFCYSYASKYKHDIKSFLAAHDWRATYCKGVFIWCFSWKSLFLFAHISVTQSVSPSTPPTLIPPAPSPQSHLSGMLWSCILNASALRWKRFDVGKGRLRRGMSVQQLFLCEIHILFSVALRQHFCLATPAVINVLHRFLLPPTPERC